MWSARKANGAKINENEKNDNEGASADSYTMRCYSKEHRSTETKYEKMHENFYENFDRFKKLC